VAFLDRFSRNESVVAGAIAPPVASSVASAATFRFYGVSRDDAMRVPTVAACRNLIVGTVAQLRVSRYRGIEQVDAGYLLTQPDPSETWLATLAKVVDDLIFHGSAALLVVARDGISTQDNPDGLPVRARHIPRVAIEQVLDDDLAAYQRIAGYRAGGRLLDRHDVIWIDAGRPGVLTIGADALTAAIEIEQAAQRLANVDLPAGLLVNESHELGPDEAAELVEGFSEARRTRSIAFLQGIRFERTSLSSADLQLTEARGISATEIARLMGVPVGLVAASPTGNSTSLLYQNVSENSAQLIRQSVAPYLVAIESALSLPTVTPRGQRVAFDVNAYLRSDPDRATRYVCDLSAAGIISADEARSYLGIAPIGAHVSDLTPGRV
jgi:HK97 family phage portal protein